MKRETL